MPACAVHDAVRNDCTVGTSTWHWQSRELHLFKKNSAACGAPHSAVEFFVHFVEFRVADLRELRPGLQISLTCRKKTPCASETFVFCFSATNPSPPHPQEGVYCWRGKENAEHDKKNVADHLTFLSVMKAMYRLTFTTEIPRTWVGWTSAGRQRPGSPLTGWATRLAINDTLNYTAALLYGSSTIVKNESAAVVPL